MTKQPMIISPADNADFNNFMINYISMYNKYPDLTDIVTWLENQEGNNSLNVQTLFNINQKWASEDPEEVFEESTLEEWAEENGWNEVFDYMKNKRMSPDDIFSEDELNRWALDNGFIEEDDDD